MARELRLDITSDSAAARAGIAGTASAVDGLARSADNLAGELGQASRAADDLTKDLAEVAAASTAAGAATDKLDAGNTKLASSGSGVASTIQGITAQVQAFGSSSDTTSGAVARLGAQLLAARDNMRNLSIEFNKTGNTKIIEDFDKQSAAFAKLSTLAKNIIVPDGKTGKESNLFEQLIPSAAKAGAEAAQTFAQVFEGGITGAFQALPPEAKGALAASLGAAALIAAPIIVGALESAILLAVGGGALAAGVALAVQDPAVASAFTGLGNTVQVSLQGAVEPFKAELIAAVGTFGATFQAVMPGITASFAQLSTVIQPLAQGLSAAFANALPGIEAAISASLPLFQQLASELPMIGVLVGNLFQTIANGGPGIALVFGFILTSVEALILGLTALVAVANAALNPMAALGSAFSGDEPAVYAAKLHEATTATKDAGSSATETAAIYNQLSQALAATAQTADASIALIVDHLVNGMLSADQAVLGFEESLTKLSAAFDKNGVSVDIHTAKGQANREAILAAVQANLQLYDSMIKSNQGTEAATAAYNTNMAALRQTAIDSGMTGAAIDELIGKYGNVPGNVATEVAANGLVEVLNNLNATLLRITDLDGKTATTFVYNNVVTTYTTGYIDQGLGHQGQARGTIRHAATGLIIGPSDPGTLIGEPQTGGEALIPLRGISQGRAMSLMRTVGSGYGLDVTSRNQRAAMSATGGWREARQTTAAAVLPPTSVIEQALASVLMKLLRTGQLKVAA